MGLIKEVCTSVYNMSITSIFVILLVIMIRVALRKSSRTFSYYLWWIVGVRLICPISFVSGLSLFNLSFFRDMQMSGKTMIWEQTQNLEQVGGWAFHAPDIAPFAAPTAPYYVVDKLKTYTIIWLVIAMLILAYQAYSYLKLKGKLQMAVRIENNVYECDQIQGPFVLGFLRPRIYIPFHLAEEEKIFVLAHERYHIKRHDYQAKLVAIIILATHWFNPFVWLAYYLFCRDMEMSCDEHVIETLGNERKQEYSNTLLNFAVGRQKWSLGTLAFGETSVVERVQNILKFKKPGKRMAIISALICIVAFTAGVTNGKQENIIKNVTTENTHNINVGRTAEYKYWLSDEMKSVLMYKEYYRDGELEDYEVTMLGSIGENEFPRDGELQFSMDFTKDENGMQCLDFIMGDEVKTALRNDFEKYGYRGVATTFLGENDKKWYKIDPDQSVVIAAFALDDLTGVTSYPSESYMNEVEKRSYISSNPGIILYYLVFSEKEISQLEKEYGISTEVRELYDARNPYIGNHVADGEVIRLLKIPEMGDCLTELQTTAEPYGMIIHFDQAPENEAQFHEKMLKKAAKFLAITENAGYFEWTYPKSGATKKVARRYYVEEMEQMLGISDLKAYAQSEETLQELYEGIENSDWAKVEAGYVCQNIMSGWRPFTNKEVITGRHLNAESDSTYLVYSYEKIKFEDITTYIFGSQYPKEKEMYIVNQP